MINKIRMKKFNRGFTLVELLVILAVLSILASVVLALTSDSRQAGREAAFRKEASSLVQPLNVVCVTEDPGYDDIADYTTFDRNTGTFSGINCGTDGNGSWSYTVDNNDGTLNVACTENGCAFTDL
jgi:prepilin-type N-terminal cleavage/methylation domain-containing protein